MKRTALIVAAILLITGLAYAGTADDMGITLKQGMVMDWSSARMKNLTTFEAAKTKPVPTWGKWNALWAGWTLDAGFAYDASAIDTVAVMIGREFGTLGDYFPIDFPLKDKISITIYPIGLYIDKIWDKAEWHGCSGGAIIKFKISI